MAKLKDLTPIDISENGALALVTLQTYVKSPKGALNRDFTYSLVKNLECAANKTTVYMIKNSDGTVKVYYVNANMKLYYFGAVPFEIFD